MRTFIRKEYTLLFIACVAIIFISGCRCGGCDLITTIDGAQIRAIDSVNTSISNQFIVEIGEKTARRDGDRNCFYKNLVKCFEDDLQMSNMTLKCNKDLVLNIGTLLANENLLAIKSLIDSNSYITVRLVLDAAFVKGVYKFVLDGKTKDGKLIRDSTDILFY